MILIDFLIGIATGVVSGFGIGGGSLLVLYLTAIARISQYTAGGINLLYFIGCAPAALIGHVRSKSIHWKVVLWCALAGVAAAIPASVLAAKLEVGLLRRLFGGILLYVSIHELRYGKKRKQSRNVD